MTLQFQVGEQWIAIDKEVQSVLFWAAKKGINAGIRFRNELPAIVPDLWNAKYWNITEGQTNVGIEGTLKKVDNDKTSFEIQVIHAHTL